MLRAEHERLVRRLNDLFGPQPTPRVRCEVLYSFAGIISKLAKNDPPSLNPSNSGENNPYTFGYANAA